MELYEVAVPSGWAGRTLADLVAGIPCSAVSLTHGGRARLPEREGTLAEGDVVHLTATVEGADLLLPPPRRPGGLTVRILIAGGGRTGATLALTLHAQQHEVRVLEHRPGVLAHIHRELPTELIYEGNATDPRTLELARVADAQVLVASMSNDAENLSLCFIARERFRVPRTIATINDPRAAWLFGPRFHVDVAVNQADILAGLIEQELSVGDMMTLLKLRQDARLWHHSREIDDRQGARRSPRLRGRSASWPPTARPRSLLRELSRALNQGQTLLKARQRPARGHPPRAGDDDGRAVARRSRCRESSPTAGRGGAKMAMTLRYDFDPAPHRRRLREALAELRREQRAGRGGSRACRWRCGRTRRRSCGACRPRSATRAGPERGSSSSASAFRRWRRAIGW